MQFKAFVEVDVKCTVRKDGFYDLKDANSLLENILYLFIICICICNSSNASKIL